MAFMHENLTPEQIADREAERVIRFISDRAVVRSQEVNVGNHDEAIAAAGAVLAMGEIMEDIQARRHRLIDFS